MSETNKVMSSLQFPNTQQPYQVNDARIPANPGAYKYMATDGEGKWVPVDRLAYNEVAQKELFNQTVGFSFYSEDNKAYNAEVLYSPFGQFVIGETYTVIWDDREYPDLVVFDAGEGGLAIGALGDEISNDRPFGIVTYEDGDVVGITFITNSTSESHEIRIIGTVINTKKLDDEFLSILTDKNANIVLFPETNITVASHIYIGNYYNLPDDFPGFEDGKRYIVTLDDTVYTLTAGASTNSNKPSVRVEGKFEIYYGNSDKEGYFIRFYDSTSAGATMLLEIAMVGSRTIKPGYLPNPIPAEYLPNPIMPVNLTKNSDGTFSASATPEELVEAYTKGKTLTLSTFSGFVFELSSIYLGKGTPSFVFAGVDLYTDANPRYVVYELIGTTVTEKVYTMTPVGVS